MVLTPDALGGNVLTNNAVIALFDALGYLLMGYMLNRLGRVRHLRLVSEMIFDSLIYHRQDEDTLKVLHSLQSVSH